MQLLAALALAALAGVLALRSAASSSGSEPFDADSLAYIEDAGPGASHLILRDADKLPPASTAEGRRALAAADRNLVDPKTVVPRPPFLASFVDPPRTSAAKCPAPVDLPDDLFMSQSGEDRMLLKWFHTLCGGSYIEMGGLDGRRYSNSYVFNQSGLGWRGVLVELVTHNYDKLVKNRPDEIATINAGVCARPQTLHYVNSGRGAVNGIYEFASPSFRDQWWPGLETLDDPRVHEIECDTLDALLLKHAPVQTFFDFFSLDVEGAEMSVLESIDFERTAFGVILVEADEHNEMKNLAMRQFLELRGYTFLYEYERSYWFTHRHFYEIYKELVYEQSS
ncbi:hypothetical protein ACHAXT_007983 [Thalassiosira profunda]